MTPERSLPALLQRLKQLITAPISLDGGAEQYMEKHHTEAELAQLAGERGTPAPVLPLKPGEGSAP